MVQATKWLHATYIYEEGEVEHISGVWPVFSFEQLFTVSAPSRYNRSIRVYGAILIAFFV